LDPIAAARTLWLESYPLPEQRPQQFYSPIGLNFVQIGHVSAAEPPACQPTQLLFSAIRPSPE
jgi:hypothetical protein